MRLEGKTAIVTGAGRGIGLAVAERFLREGAVVYGADLRFAEGWPESGRLHRVEADVSDEDAVRRLVDRAGAVDILVNNAGIVEHGDVVTADDAQWERILRVNLRAAVLCSRHVIPLMAARGGGAIVNAASINGIRGNYDMAAYASSKGAIVALTMSMALDFAGRGVRVNCVCPGTIERTGMTAGVDEDPEKRAALAAKHPLGRLGTPEDVAGAVLFLASEDASFITGLALPVDGGRHVR
jgi:NAD(P)-dependent dehydrogenase (short-subunit alcohol dehydrogenase family)